MQINKETNTVTISGVEITQETYDKLHLWCFVALGNGIPAGKEELFLSFTSYTPVSGGVCRLKYAQLDSIIREVKEAPKGVASRFDNMLKEISEGISGAIVTRARKQIAIRDIRGIDSGSWKKQKTTDKIMHESGKKPIEIVEELPEETVSALKIFGMVANGYTIKNLNLEPLSGKVKCSTIGTAPAIVLSWNALEGLTPESPYWGVRKEVITSILGLENVIIRGGKPKLSIPMDNILYAEILNLCEVNVCSPTYVSKEIIRDLAQRELANKESFSVVEGICLGLCLFKNQNELVTKDNYRDAIKEEATKPGTLTLGKDFKYKDEAFKPKGNAEERFQQIFNLPYREGLRKALGLLPPAAGINPELISMFLALHYSIYLPPLTIQIALDKMKEESKSNSNI